jgi:hypothetical protein
MTEGASTLPDFSVRLAKAPRRRDFKAVPMILDHPELWDAAALDEVIAYRGAYKQVWDNTAIEGPWLNLMRNSINAQIFSFRHPDFLAISATHGSAHLALFDQPTWDKYRLVNLAGDKFKTNTLLLAKPAASAPAITEIRTASSDRLAIRSQRCRAAASSSLPATTRSGNYRQSC